MTDVLNHVKNEETIITVAKQQYFETEAETSQTNRDTMSKQSDNNCDEQPEMVKEDEGRVESTQHEIGMEIPCTKGNQESKNKMADVLNHGKIEATIITEAEQQYFETEAETSQTNRDTMSKQSDNNCDEQPEMVKEDEGRLESTQHEVGMEIPCTKCNKGAKDRMTDVLNHVKNEETIITEAEQQYCETEAETSQTNRDTMSKQSDNNCDEQPEMVKEDEGRVESTQHEIGMEIPCTKGNQESKNKMADVLNHGKIEETIITEAEQQYFETEAETSQTNRDTMSKQSDNNCDEQPEMVKEDEGRLESTQHEVGMEIPCTKCNKGAKDRMTDVLNHVKNEETIITEAEQQYFETEAETSQTNRDTMSKQSDNNCDEQPEMVKEDEGRVESRQHEIGMEIPCTKGNQESKNKMADVLNHGKIEETIITEAEQQYFKTEAETSQTNRDTMSKQSDNNCDEQPEMVKEDEGRLESTQHEVGMEIPCTKCNKGAKDRMTDVLNHVKNEETIITVAEQQYFETEAETSQTNRDTMSKQSDNNCDEQPEMVQEDEGRVESTQHEIGMEIPCTKGNEGAKDSMTDVLNNGKIEKTIITVAEQQYFETEAETSQTNRDTMSKQSDNNCDEQPEMVKRMKAV
ncbi:unnamed protein product [Mytilus edulis]|uniref:Uncharacterized protein n=1 Tax=Mytilus edulis TaxID=6550 RepID=A0A8S3UHF6_MYTED|nr:unnamed protein product [Mytilus edulis]